MFFLEGILYADAKNSDGIPLAIKCEWFRVRGDRTYPIPQISSNVYQLSAEDVGCQIQVQARPIDTEEETGSEGLAFGQFGPIELDPQAKQTLESVLGTGGSQFPVSIVTTKKADQEMDDTEEHVDDDADDGGFIEDDNQGIATKMFVNQHMIKICIGGGDADGSGSTPSQEERKGG